VRSVILTFTILDAVTFCKRKYACIRDSKKFTSSAAHLPTWVTHVVIPFAESVGGAGLKKTWVPQKLFRYCTLHMAEGGTFLRNMPCHPVCGYSDDTQFCVDSAVEKHVQALCTSGMEGWESEGSKFTEWQTRKACVSMGFDQRDSRRSYARD
jgi:hypothetical protein